MSDHQTPTQRAGILVIGYGNTLRRDDGVGPKVAEAVAALNLPGVSALACHQLTPELAEPISRAQKVIFVDADSKPKGDVSLRKIKPGDAGEILAHASDPRSLLALANQVFGRNPSAWAVAIPVEDFGFGDGLSSYAEAGMQSAVRKIQALAQKSQRAKG